MITGKILCIILLLSFSCSAFSINLQKFNFSSSPTFSTVEDGLNPNGLITTDYKYIITSSYNYVRAPLIETLNNDRSRTIIEWMHSVSLGGGYKLTKDIQIGINTFATYINAIEANAIKNHENIFTLGDSTLDLKYLVNQRGKLAIGLSMKMTLPTGDESYYTSDSATGYYLGFILDHAFSFAQASLNIGHKENHKALYKDIDYRRQLHLSLGVLIPLTKTFDLTTEFYKDSPYNPKNDQSPSEISIGVRKNIDTDTALYAGFGTGSFQESTSTDARVYIGFKYYPSNKEKSIKVKKEEAMHGKYSKTYTLYFKTSSSSLEKSEITKLNEMISYFRNDPYISKIIIEGYTSNTGSKSLNYLLSKARAITVLNHLDKNGIKSRLLDFIGHGNSKANNILKNDKMDRKVEFRIYRSR